MHTFLFLYFSFFIHVNIPKNLESIEQIMEKLHSFIFFVGAMADLLVVRVQVTHENITKAMRFKQACTVRELLFETARNLSTAGIEIEDVINFNFQFNPSSYLMNSSILSTLLLCCVLIPCR